MAHKCVQGKGGDCRKYVGLTDGRHWLTQHTGLPVASIIDSLRSYTLSISPIRLVAVLGTFHRKTVLIKSDRMPAMKQAQLQRGLNIEDAQELLHIWKGLPPPRSIITSPPYLDMHNYGNASQIGIRGQSVEDYLIQMSSLFGACYNLASVDATFWLVAGAVRRDGRLIPLPDRLATCAEETGWTLREVITWDKQKALPWTHHGELRDVTEQVLLFSKGEDYRFDPNDLRSPIPNSTWWRRYPERYSPFGAMPTNLWSIPIPTQGSWAGIRTHFCPFPEELTYRMLSLTTAAGDVVLDPLAGVGSVPRNG